MQPWDGRDRATRQTPTGLAVLVLCGALIAAVLGWATLPVQAQPTNATTYPVYTATEITTNATTVVLAVPGVVHSVCFNKVGASSNTATLYNALTATGTPFATFDTTAAALVGGCHDFDAALSVGLTVVTATGTAPQMTVTYRALR